MQNLRLLIFIAILVTAVPVWGETFQWIDDDGVTHLSDNASSIPEAYRDEVTEIEDPYFNTHAPPKKLYKSRQTRDEIESAEDADSSEPEKYRPGSAEFAALERQLADIWSRMRHDLRRKKIEAALAYFTENSRASYRGLFTGVRPALPRIALEMGEARLVKVMEDSFAECDLRREENGTTYSYMLQFVLDYDGVWRIRAF